MEDEDIDIQDELAKLAEDVRALGRENLTLREIIDALKTGADCWCPTEGHRSMTVHSPLCTAIRQLLEAK